MASDIQDLTVLAHSNRASGHLGEEHVPGVGAVKESLSLNERVFHCDVCGHVQDRDENAVCNLRNLARSSRVTACGGEGRSVPSVKQEPNTMSYPLWIEG